MTEVTDKNNRTSVQVRGQCFFNTTVWRTQCSHIKCLHTFLSERHSHTPLPTITEGERHLERQ